MQSLMGGTPFGGTASLGELNSPRVAPEASLFRCFPFSLPLGRPMFDPNVKNLLPTPYSLLPTPYSLLPTP